MHERFAVQQRAVARPEVFDVDRAVARGTRARVHGGDERVVGQHDAATAAATNGELVAEREALALAGGRFEDAQAFNITYLLDVLQNIATDTVRLAFGDANSSALVTMPEREDYKYVVMPMRI